MLALGFLPAIASWAFCTLREPFEFEPSGQQRTLEIRLHGILYVFTIGLLCLG